MRSLLKTLWEKEKMLVTFLDCPKFKEAADENWNVAIQGF